LCVFQAKIKRRTNYTAPAGCILKESPGSFERRRKKSINLIYRLPLKVKEKEKKKQAVYTAHA